MASAYTDEVTRSRIARRLSLLPASIGMIGVGLVPLGALAMGLTEAPRGWAVTGVAVSLVVATVMTGASFGLYLGLATLAVAGLAVDGPPSLPELTALTLTVLAVHETVRFSLDARRPSRFGPGLIGGYLGRSALLGAVVVAMTAAAWQLADQPPRSMIWMPIGLATIALPLLAGRGARVVDQVAVFDRPEVRAVVAVVLTGLVLGVVVVAAKARTAIESGPGPSGPAPTPTTTPPTTVQELVPTDPATISRVLLLVGVIAAVLVLGVLYLALRRPEALFELDELDNELEDTSFGIALPGQADQVDEVIEVDDQDLAELLKGLQLDIAGEKDPGRAIRFGYANIERTLAGLRLTRDDSETEREFLARALPNLGSAGPSMISLTKLFERARFGHDRIDEPMRQQALLAVTDLLHQVSPQPRPEDQQADGDRT